MDQITRPKSQMTLSSLQERPRAGGVGRGPRHRRRGRAGGDLVASAVDGGGGCAAAVASPAATAASCATATSPAAAASSAVTTATSAARVTNSRPVQRGLNSADSRKPYDMLARRDRRKVEGSKLAPPVIP